MWHQRLGLASGTGTRLAGAFVLMASAGLFACQGTAPLEDCAACGGESDWSPRAGGLIVSDPFPNPAGPGGARVAWVALGRGTVPAGATAVVRSSSGASGRTAVVNGGFDPTPVPAAVGDTIFALVQDPLGRPVDSLQAEVRGRKPPVIVRTEPPPRKRDVPLNASLLVVFSEPVDPSTVSSITVRLLNGTLSIPGQIQLSADGMRAYFRPASLLQPDHDYTFEVTAGIRGLGGDPLATPQQVTFSTGVKPSGFLRLITSTNGLALDPDGYRAIVDADTSGAPVLMAPDTVVVPVDEGTHSIRLTGANAPTCVVLNPDWSGTVQPAMTTTILFRTACFHGPRTGLEMEIRTTGSNVGEDYMLTVCDDARCAGYRWGGLVLSNSVVPVDLPAGLYRYRLAGVPPHCTGQTTGAAVVPEGQVVSVRLELVCSSVALSRAGASP